MLPRLIREDEELHQRLSRAGSTQDQHHCCIAALVSDTARNIDKLVNNACNGARGIRSFLETGYMPTERGKGNSGLRSTK